MKTYRASVQHANPSADLVERAKTALVRLRIRAWSGSAGPNVDYRIAQLLQIIRAGKGAAA